MTSKSSEKTRVKLYNYAKEFWSWIKKFKNAYKQDRKQSQSKK